MNITKKIGLYLNETVSKNIYKSLTQKSRPATWTLVDREGKEVPHTQILKTYPTAYKEWNRIIKDGQYKKDNLYIVNIKKSTGDKLATEILIDQPYPKFNFKKI